MLPAETRLQPTLEPCVRSGHLDQEKLELFIPDQESEQVPRVIVKDDQGEAVTAVKSFNNLSP